MWFKETLKNARNSKKSRIIFIIVLILIMAIIAYLFEKVRWFMIGMIVLMLGALWMQMYDYDFDLWKLMETKSFTESRVDTVTDSDGNSYSVITGTCNKNDFDLNCDDFATQEEAQNQYNTCADSIQADNPSIDVKKLDIYGLDWNNNGIVCEALPD